MKISVSLLSELLLRNPFVIVYLIAIVLAYTKLKEKSVKASHLVIAGCVISIIVSYGGQYLVYYMYESSLIDTIGQEKFMLVYSLISTVLHAVGFFLILAAVFADRDGKDEDPYQSQSVFS